MIPQKKNDLQRLRCILRHCGVQEVHPIPQDLRALHLDLFVRDQTLSLFR